MARSIYGYHIVIPTRKRVDEQWTLKTLPEWLHPIITIVCPADEVKAHTKNWPNVRVIGQPARIQKAAEKREWIARHAKGYVFMLDDDLSNISVFNHKTEKYVKVQDDPKLTRKVFTEVLPKLIKEYDGIGFGWRLFSNNFKGGLYKDKRMCIAYGMSQRLRDSISWTRVDDYCDTDYSLQAIRGGYPTAVTFAVICQQKKEGGPGGLSDERTRDRIVRSRKVLIKLHPNIVFAHAENAKNPVSGLRVSWRNALKEGLINRKKLEGKR